MIRLTADAASAGIMTWITANRIYTEVSNRPSNHPSIRGSMNGIWTNVKIASIAMFSEINGFDYLLVSNKSTFISDKGKVAAGSVVSGSDKYRNLGAYV